MWKEFDIEKKHEHYEFVLSIWKESFHVMESRLSKEYSEWHKHEVKKNSSLHGMNISIEQRQAKLRSDSSTIRRGNLRRLSQTPQKKTQKLGVHIKMSIIYFTWNILCPLHVNDNLIIIHRFSWLQEDTLELVISPFVRGINAIDPVAEKFSSMDEISRLKMVEALPELGIEPAQLRFLQDDTLTITDVCWWMWPCGRQI